jgi:hypothetical protein
VPAVLASLPLLLHLKEMSETFIQRFLKD